MPFTIRDFNTTDFDALWRIDQTCFPPGISYSRTELRLYMRRRASFTLVAEGSAAATERASIRSEHHSAATDTSIVGFIVAEAGSRARGHIITIDVIGEARRFGVGSLFIARCRGSSDYGRMPGGRTGDSRR